MLLPSRRRSPFVACLFATLFFAATADAIWLGTDPYVIEILLPGDIIHRVDSAAEVQPGDVMNQIFVGNGPTAGEVTVSSEGTGGIPKVLGLWSINNGIANVEGVVGTGARFRVGSSGSASATPGVLHLKSSDVEGSASVYEGTMTLEASKLGGVEVFDDASLFLALSSQIGNLTTKQGAYASIQESIASSDLHCDQVGTVFVQDGTLRCGRATVENGGAVEIESLLGLSVLDVADALTLRDGSLDVSGTDATTGSIVMAGANTELDIASSDWTNQDGLAFQPSAVVGPVEMRVGGGAHYHDGESVLVAGHPAYQHLTVTGMGTEFEVDGDLRIGEYVNFQGEPSSFSGNVTVADGATVIVHGQLALQSSAVLNIESGATVYAADVDDDGTINENGGTLVVPEAEGDASILAAITAIAAAAQSARSGHA